MRYTWARLLLGSSSQPSCAPLSRYSSIFCFSGSRPSEGERSSNTKSGHNGSARHVELAEPYHKLILATGSRPFVPPLEGRDKRGVFVFRTLDDCWTIADAARQAKRAVVIGGGLLGLEAARGLLSYGVEVTDTPKQTAA